MIWATLLFTVLCVLDTAETALTNQIRFARYLEFENKKTSTFQLSESQETSQRKCAKICTGSVGCESFFYNANAGQCDLRQALFINSNDTVEDHGAMYYYVMKGKSDWCPSWKGFQLAAEDGPCLKFEMNSTSWHDANETCVSSTPNSQLLVLSSQAKRDLVVSLAEANGLSGTFFIGLYEYEQNNYRWVDGSDVSYTDWHTADNSDPNTEDCVHMLGWRWVRNACSVPRRSVCEMTPDKNLYLEMMNFVP